jgi:hypothetical protein
MLLVSANYAVSPINDLAGGGGLGALVSTKSVLARGATYVTREKALDCFAFALTAGNYRNQSVIETFKL